MCEGIVLAKPKIVVETYQKFYDLLSLVNEVEIEINLKFPPAETHTDDFFHGLRCYYPAEDTSTEYVEVYERLRFWDNRQQRGIVLWVKTGRVPQ